MRTQVMAGALMLALTTALVPTHNHAFTAQLPISGYEFTDVLQIYEADVGALETLFTVPEDRIAVVTDIYVALDSGASGAHTTFISDNGLTKFSGPFPVTAGSPFSKSYTSGIIFVSGESIVASDTGGTGNVTVNLVGYIACATPCD